MQWTAVFRLCPRSDALGPARLNFAFAKNRELRMGMEMLAVYDTKQQIESRTTPDFLAQLE
jgi:hypothetical protein